MQILPFTIQVFLGLLVLFNQITGSRVYASGFSNNRTDFALFGGNSVTGG